MGKHKSDRKDKGKDSQLLIRIDKAEREAFVSICEKLDTSAAREIRRFMREFVAAQAGQAVGVAGVTAEAPVVEVAEAPAPVSESTDTAAAPLDSPAPPARKPRKPRSPAAAQ
jgi:hypothetical protein